MSDLYWLNDTQMAKLEPFFPKSHGKPRVDDRRVLSGIIFINRNGLRWRDAPAEYGPHKTLYSRWKRWSEKGIFARMLLELADQGGGTDTLMIDATHLKTHRTASSLGLKKGGGGRLIGRTKGGMNSKLHAVTDAAGRPLRMFLTAGQRNDYIGARALLDGLPPAEHMLADRGYDADWYREALEDKGITPCIPSRKNRKVPIPHDEARYRKRHKIENSFARLKDWRRVATRYDRCPKVFLSACALAAVVMFWL
ncbi:IS5 family transposase [Tritonibacter mobilis]|uniref:IS5 family transposase n=1 Tax=Tritonibacter mobilis TaxID=379347 RepID=UPI000DA1568D|nr:IS5 family transposase [Tritonibacter mobilis]